MTTVTAVAYSQTGEVIQQWVCPQPVEVTLPYDGSASKNRRLGVSKSGRIYRQKETKQFARDLLWLLKDALCRQESTFSPLCKTWVWLLLKKREKGRRKDVSNLVDEVCDVVKDTLGIDDAWFSVVCDWQFTDEQETITIRLWQ